MMIGYNIFKKASIIIIAFFMLSTTTAVAIKINQNFKDMKCITSSDETWFVPDDFPTIQEAINNAEEGDTIYVREGVYNEIITITTKRLTLIGENKENTIIDVEGIESSAVFINADYVEFNGFTVSGSKYNDGGGIDLGSANYCIIEDNIIINNHYGINLIDSHHNLLYNNIIHSTLYYGIFLDDGHDRSSIEGSCNYNEIKDNVITGCSSGIFIRFSYSNIVKNNVIESHKKEGLILAYADKNEITNNVISGNKDGISIHNAFDNVILDNSIKENQIGIHITRCLYDKVTLSENNLMIDNDKDIVIGRGLDRNLFLKEIISRILGKIAQFSLF